MTNIQVIAKESHDIIANLTADNVQFKLTEASVVRIDVNFKDVAEIKRDGNNAIVVMKNGEQIVIENFFAENTTTNSLVFKDSQDKLIWAQFTDATGASQSVSYGYIQSIEPLLYQQGALAPLLYGLGVAGLVAGGIELLRSGDDNTAPANVPTPVVIQNDAQGLAGTAKAGSTVIITLPNNGGTFTTVADASGNWRLANNPLAPGEIASVTARDPDGATSAPTNTRRDDVADSPTTAPVVTDDAVPITGNLADSSQTNDQRPTLSGTGTAGQIITVYDNSTAIGSTTVQANGTWSFTPATNLSEGNHPLSYTARIGTGTESAQSPTINITVDTVAPTAAIVTAVGDNAKTAAEATDAAGVITVQAENGSTSVVTFTGVNGIVTKTILNDGTAQPVTLSAAELVTLGNGDVEVSTVTTDVAGNSSITADGNDGDFNLDSVAPGAPSAILNAASDTGTLGDGITNDTTPTISGTGNPNDIIRVTFPGSNEIVSVTVAGDGTWSVTPTQVASTGTAEVTATDTAGNVSPSTNVALTIDTTAPAAPSAILNAASDTGTLGDGITNDTTPTISGTGNPNDVIRVTFPGSNEIVSVTVAGDGTWSVTPRKLPQQVQRRLPQPIQQVTSVQLPTLP